MGYQINNRTKEIELTRGDTLKVKIDIFINDEIYTPRPEDSLSFSMKTTYNTSKLLVHKDIPIDTCILHLEPQDTKGLRFGEYVYDIQITFANGDVNTFISGTFKLKPEVE